MLILLLINILQFVFLGQFLTMHWPLWGFLTNIFATSYFISYSLLHHRRRLLMASAALLPLINIFQLFLSPLDPIYSSLIIHLTVLLAITYLLHYVPASYHGFQTHHHPWWQYFSYGFTGLIIGATIAVLVPLTPIQNEFILIAYLLLTPLVVTAEELLFRYTLQNQAYQLVHPIWCIFFAALAYAFLFIPLGGQAAVLAFIVGLFLSVIHAVDRDRLYLTTTANAAIKLSYLIFSFLFQ